MIKQTYHAVFLGYFRFDLSAAGRQCQAKKPFTGSPQMPLNQSEIIWVQ
jgi:hypothetical protein